MLQLLALELLANVGTIEILGVSSGETTSELPTRSFAPTGRDRKLWRRIMKRSHTQRIYHLLQRIEIDLAVLKQQHTGEVKSLGSSDSIGIQVD